MGEQPTNDIFLKTLWEILDKESNYVKTQVPRFNKLWGQFLIEIEPEPHQIHQLVISKQAFDESIQNKIQYLKDLEVTLIDGYYAVKSVVSTFFTKYFQNSPKFLTDFKEEDRESVIFLTAEILIGSLLQFLTTEKEILPLKYIVIALNKSLLKLKGLTDEKILEKLRSNGFESSIETIHQLMDDLIKRGYIEKSALTEEDKLKGKEGQFFYKWNQNKDFTLSPETNIVFKGKIVPILEWAIELWRTMFNLRELNVDILDSYKWKTFLEKTVKKSATQGFMTAYWVIKNIRKYYEMVLEDKPIAKPD